VLEQARNGLAIQETSQRLVAQRMEAETRYLPDDWQSQSMHITPDEVALLEAEQADLAGYSEQQRQLLGAQALLEELEQQEQETRAWMERVPVEAQRPVADVERDLATAEGTFNRANTEQSNLQSELDRLNRSREERDAMARQQRQAERRAHLHKRLADLLGRGGLQLALLRGAEVAIVEEANEILERLSSGRQRLDLHSVDGQADVALDLLCRDEVTGSHPIPIGLVSGSQRFRIAVSLALAIGRYLSHESQRIRSVIIDEGFGSLDKAGRGDMISVLQDLQTKLERIILVSHQEEIAEVFPNGYTVRLVDGAARVTLAAAE
jgi:DNA repair exonuclease SbcCD ATPase subunit